MRWRMRRWPGKDAPGYAHERASLHNPGKILKRIIKGEF